MINVIIDGPLSNLRGFFVILLAYYVQQTMSQCWLDVGPSSVTLAQHSTNIGSFFSAYFYVTRDIIRHPQR